VRLGAEIAVFYTIAGAVLCWACAEASRSRSLWTAGAILALVHSIAAFVVFYDGSHDTARLQTMWQTEALTGLSFGGGIYVNYAFLLVWLGDAAWWWTSPLTHAMRAPALSWAIRGFLLFIILNGAVVFADGWARVVGIVSISIALFGMWTRRVRLRSAHRAA
jgi:hypothetical protein